MCCLPSGVIYTARPKFRAIFFRTFRNFSSARLRPKAGICLQCLASALCRAENVVVTQLARRDWTGLHTQPRESLNFISPLPVTSACEKQSSRISLRLHFLDSVRMNTFPVRRHVPRRGSLFFVTFLERSSRSPIRRRSRSSCFQRSPNEALMSFKATEQASSYRLTRRTTACLSHKVPQTGLARLLAVATVPLPGNSLDAG